MQGPALGLPPASHSNNSGGNIASVIGSIFDPFDMMGAARELASDIIHAPVEIAHEAGAAFTGGVNAVGGAVTSVAHEAGNAVDSVASSFLSSPVVLIGGAAVLLILLSR